MKSEVMRHPSGCFFVSGSFSNPVENTVLDKVD